MKYIRTKDGRILSLNEFKYEKKYHWYRPNEKYLDRLDIGFTCWHWCFDDEYDLIPEVLGKIMVEKIKREECKFADAIEELCDKWILLKDNEKPLIKDVFSVSYCKEHYKDKGYECYLTIFTNKGLIYVAKMNEEGELELL